MAETWKDELDGTIKSLIGRHVRDGAGLADATDWHIDEPHLTLEDLDTEREWFQGAPLDAYDQELLEEVVRENVTVESSVDILARARAEGEAEQLVGIERCARCGCTDLTPCAEGCGWAEPTLCTRCVAAELV